MRVVIGINDRDDDATPPFRLGDLSILMALADPVPLDVPPVDTDLDGVIHWLNGADSSIRLIMEAAVARTLEDLSQITVATRDRVFRLAVALLLAACFSAAAALCALYVCLVEKSSFFGWLAFFPDLPATLPITAPLLERPCHFHSVSESAIKSVQRV